MNDENKFLYNLAGLAALLAMGANLLDIFLGFGDSEVVTYGTQSASEWFALFSVSWFKGIYALGILNLVYMLCMLPVYLGMVFAHRNNRYLSLALLAASLFLLSFAVYAANNAAIPMLVLSGRYAAAPGEAQKAVFAAAGEAILARGEDFTPGAFPGLIVGGLAAILLAFVMLRGGVFGKVNAWIGLVGFTFLALFTIIATFIPTLYMLAFYFFGMFGGLLALAWFILTARTFFKLGRAAR